MKEISSVFMRSYILMVAGNAAMAMTTPGDGPSEDTDI